MNIWIEVDKLISESKYDDAIRFLEAQIIKSEIREFQPLIGLKISDEHNDVLSKTNEFISHNQKKFDVKSIYFEMNGFDINYDRWYFDYFAYDTYSEDREDPDWLCEWKSEDWPETTIHGLEPAQKVFEWYHEEKIWESRPEIKDTYEAAMLLIMSKFIQFISFVITSGKLSKPVIVFATAHDFETIGMIKS